MISKETVGHVNGQLSSETVAVGIFEHDVDLSLCGDIFRYITISSEVFRFQHCIITCIYIYTYKYI